MTIKIAQAVAAYVNAGKVGPGMAAREEGGGFADMVQQAAQNSVAALQKGEAASVQAVSGKADLAEVVTAVTNAEATLQTVAALRDRVISAYQEILRMPI
jgi:flagellar hook-basal body complex protein FliE